MIEQSINDIVKACHGTIINKGNMRKIKKISTDTRTIEEGSLFIPLIGENFDGHEYINAAIEKGAGAILTHQNRIDKIENIDDITIVQVKDTLEALKDIAQFYKELFEIPFIGITGSVGKTTTKDLISGVLSAKYNVHKNIGNLNNQIGLPMSLLNLEKKHNISVLEMGMSSYGEILNLANIVKPNIAIISNIGLSHIEYFGSKENIMKAKMEITKNLTKGSYLLLNGDDEYLKEIKKDNKEYEIVFYGLSPNNDFYPSNIKDLGEYGSEFNIEINGIYQTYKIKQPGIHNVYNALGAIWIGIYYNMSNEEIQNGLYNIEMSKMRLEITNKNNIKIINDAYNASPDSMKSALDVLSNINCKRKIAILGNIYEMGNFAEEGHRNVGKYLANTDVNILITVGNMAKWIGLEAEKDGFNKKNIFPVSNNKDAIDTLKNLVQDEDAILIKGSRSMKMEEVVKFLQERS